MLIFLISILVALNQQDGWFYLYTLQDTILPVTMSTPDPETGGEIELRGSKTISISTGSGGLQINQGLELTINGKTGKWGRIQGVISDNSENPSGIISRSLSGYSEVYLKYYYRNFSWCFGKFNYGSKWYSSPMVGGMMEYRKSLNLKIAYGEIPGVLKTRTFTDIRNPAIPIRITDEGEKIVEGTFKAFLNGRPLAENRDYSVDYLTGTFYFLPGIDVDPEGKLRVEYISAESFGRKSFTALEFSTTGGKHFLELSFDEERDDRDYWLKNLGREALDSIKNADGRIKVPTWRFVGEGEGDYDLVDSFFVFRGEGKGSYTVSFTFVGDGNGDYRFNDAGGFFYFAGRGEGDYTPYVIVTPPERKRRIFLNSGLKFGNFSLKGGTFLALLDKNIFSGKGESRDVNGFVGAEYSGKNLRGRFWFFQSDSGGRFLSGDLENFSGRGFLVSLALKKFADFRPEVFYSRADQGYQVKFSLSGRFYRLFYEETDSQKFYGAKFSLSSGNVRAYFGAKRVYATDYAYDQVSGGAEYVPHLKLKTSRRLFDDGKIEDGLNLRFQANRLTLGYRLVKTTPGDSIFQTIKGEFSGFSGDISYFFRLLFREDMQEEVSYRYVFVGEGNGSFSFDSTSGRFYQDPLGSYERQVVFTGKNRGIRNQSGDLSFSFKGLSLKYSGAVKFANDILSNQRNFYLTYTGRSLYGSYTKVSGSQLDEKNEFEEGVVEIMNKRIMPGVKFSRVSGIGIQSDKFAEVYTRIKGRGMVFKLGGFFRPSYPAGLSGGFKFNREFFSGTFGTDINLTYVSDAPPGVYPSDGFSIMYTLTYRHRIFSNTGGIMELRGRRQKDRHIYNFRVSLSIQF